MMNYNPNSSKHSLLPLTKNRIPVRTLANDVNHKDRLSCNALIVISVTFSEAPTRGDKHLRENLNLLDRRINIYF